MLALLKLAKELSKMKKVVFQRTRIWHTPSFLKVRCHLANAENNVHTKTKKREPQRSMKCCLILKSLIEERAWGVSIPTELVAQRACLWVDVVDHLQDRVSQPSIHLALFALVLQSLQCSHQEGEEEEEKEDDILTLSDISEDVCAKMQSPWCWRYLWESYGMGCSWNDDTGSHSVLLVSVLHTWRNLRLRMTNLRSKIEEDQIVTWEELSELLVEE